jgi:hypothetical protein
VHLRLGDVRLELDGVGAGLRCRIDQALGLVDAAVVVVADLGDDERVSGRDGASLDLHADECSAGPSGVCAAPREHRPGDTRLRPMEDRDIGARIASFPIRHYDFELQGHHTNVDKAEWQRLRAAASSKQAPTRGLPRLLFKRRSP